MTFQEAKDQYTQIEFIFIPIPLCGNESITFYPTIPCITVSEGLYDYMLTELDNNENPYHFLNDLPVQVVLDDSEGKLSVIEEYVKGYLPEYNGQYTPKENDHTIYVD